MVSVFQILVYPNKQYKIKVRNRPSIPESVDHWNVFDDDKHITIFMQMSGEFRNVKIDQENMFEEEESVEPIPKYLTQLAGKDII